MPPEVPGACPFCGSATGPKLGTVEPEVPTRENRGYYVRCEDCGVLSQTPNHTRREALTAWFRRSRTDA